jgi:polysaccharide biosynthesis/export protein
LFNSLVADLRPTTERRRNRAHVLRLLVAAVTACSLAACQSVGPSRGAIERAGTQQTIPGLHVVEFTEDVARQLAADPRDRDTFAQDFGGAQPAGNIIGIGDTVEVTIWEASPPALFGTTNLDTSIGTMPQGSRPNSLPGILVGPSGAISIPFAGQVPAAGRTPRQIEQEIVRRLQGRAHLPQVMVRIARNVTSTVTVLGDVHSPKQVSLTPHGERVLDAISEAGGTDHPLDRMTIQLTRGNVVRRMAVQDIVARPQNNVILESGDVVTALFQPFSFTVLGAAGKNEEVPFESTGITLSQALGRVGGLQGDRADPKGVFIFRWESAVPGIAGGGELPASDRTIPVIYKIDMRRPETYLTAQKFEMRDGDVLYVSNSPVSDLQRFVGIVASSILPFSAVRTITQ